MNTYNMQTAEDANGHKDYVRALKKLLYILADDNFIVGYRGSEWLGLAPHIEADVAFCSIAQDHMGHAALFYRLLEELGEGKADDLAQLREAGQFRNAIIVERPNGEGDYIVNPNYDWAYSVVRQYFYDLFEQVRMTSLKQSSYTPLAQAADKVMREKHYHVLHGETWFKQMATTTTEAKEKLQAAIQKVWNDLGGLYQLGDTAQEMNTFGLIESEEMLRQRYLEKLKKIFQQLNLSWPGNPDALDQNGRDGEHTEDLSSALSNISEVYRQDPAANW